MELVLRIRRVSIRLLCVFIKTDVVSRQHVESITTRIMWQPKSTYEDNAHPTIFHEILQSNVSAESDQTVSRLKDKALIVVGAGTLTTSWALSVAIYHLLASPRILAKLKTELREIYSNAQFQVSLPQLEQLS